MHRSVWWPVPALFLVLLLACRSVDPPLTQPDDDALRIGFGGFIAGAQTSGLNAIIPGLVQDRLLIFGQDGRAVQNLVQEWTPSADRRDWRLRLLRNVHFQDGTPLTSAIVADILRRQLPRTMGSAARHVRDVRVASDDAVEVVLNEPSSFLVEGLEIPVQLQGRNSEPVTTGPFVLAGRTDSEVTLVRNASYHAGAPHIERVFLKQYGSLRSAWADLLRGEVDMLYEVGVDAQDFLEPSSHTRVFTFQRSYANMVLLNVRRPHLRDAAVRRALNAAVDRPMLLATVLNGHGTPAEGPVPPLHWAYDQNMATLRYEPRMVEPPLEFTCFVGDASLERMALAVQQQLQAVGVTMRVQLGTVDEAVARVQSGDFDAILADTASGPHILRLHQFWYTNGPNNYGGFSSKAVDAAFDAIERAPDDRAYKEGVSALQRAMVNDPPAIFLAWGERARAVSTRFEVPIEPGRDILATLRLWRPLAPPRINSTY